MRKIRFVGDVYRPGDVNIDRFQVARLSGKFVHQAVDPPAGVLIGLCQIDAGFIYPGHCHNVDGFGDVIEDHHLIVKSKGQIGDMPIIRWDIGQMFVVADGVVTGVSDRTAIKGGQLRQMHRPNGLHPVSQFFQADCRIQTVW